MICHCCGGDYKQLSSNVFECNNCKHIYRLYEGNSIAYHRELYRNIERRDKKEIDLKGLIKPLFHQKRKKICKKRIEEITPYLTSIDKCLDIGGGAGTFANLLKDKVGSVECTELAPNLINELKRQGFIVYEEDFLKLEISKTYDVLFAWHVLEHIIEIQEFIKKAAFLTKRFFVLEIPTLKSLNGRGRERSLTDPSEVEYDGHAHYFSSESLKILVEQFFRIIDFKEGIQSPSILVVLEKI